MRLSKPKRCHDIAWCCWWMLAAKTVGMKHRISKNKTKTSTNSKKPTSSDIDQTKVSPNIVQIFFWGGGLCGGGPNVTLIHVDVVTVTYCLKSFLCDGATGDGMEVLKLHNYRWSGCLNITVDNWNDWYYIWRKCSSMKNRRTLVVFWNDQNTQEEVKYERVYI